MDEKWDYRFLDMAKLVSTWSKDPSTKVGAVIVGPKNRIVSVGYNGFSRHTKDDLRLEDRETKLKIIIHGEMNAIHFANKELDDCTLYTYPFMPCSNCASHIIQRDIKRVVSYYNNNPRWEESFKISTSLFLEAGVDLVLYKFTA
jgi:dCMP deaminase